MQADRVFHPQISQIGTKEVTWETVISWIRFQMELATLQWSEEEPPVEIKTGEQLDQLLDRLQAESSSDFPNAVRLRAHQVQLDILIGLPESFVYVNDINEKREHITLGNASDEGVVTFYLLRQHHTEFKRRHLIPLATARRVARDFFDSGRLPSNVKWEEGLY